MCRSVDRFPKRERERAHASKISNVYLTIINVELVSREVNSSAYVRSNVLVVLRNIYFKRKRDINCERTTAAKKERNRNRNKYEMLLLVGF